MSIFNNLLILTVLEYALLPVSQHRRSRGKQDFL